MADLKSLSPGTTVALSLVVSLVVAGFQYGIVFSDLKHAKESVSKLEARADAASATQQTQTIELATMRENIRFIRESTARIERAVEALTPAQRRTVQRGAE